MSRPSHQGRGWGKVTSLMFNLSSEFRVRLGVRHNYETGDSLWHSTTWVSQLHPQVSSSWVVSSKEEAGRGRTKQLSPSLFLLLLERFRHLSWEKGTVGSGGRLTPDLWVSSSPS